MHSLNDWRHLRIGKKLFQEYIAHHGLPDIIHAHSALQGGHLALLISEAEKIPFVLTEHSSAYARKLLRDSELSLSRKIFESATRLISVSSSLARDLQNVAPTTSGKWEIIPNSVDVDYFRSKEVSSPNLKKSFNFLVIAHLNKNKDISNLLQAVKEIEGKADFRLRIGGAGEEEGNLKKFTADLGIAKSIDFLGNLSRKEILDEISNADVFILPSKYETFGVVLIEALALGKPIIATKCGGPNDIVEPHNGILVPVGDPKSLSRAMLDVKKNIDKYSPEYIRKRCIEKFSSSAVSKYLEKLYHETLNSDRRN